MHTPWFRSPAILAAPIGALLAVVYLQDATDPFGYSAAAIAQGGIALTVIAPYCALFGVLEGARYRAAANMVATSNRRLVTIVARLLAPVVAVGVLLLLFAFYFVAATDALPQSIMEILLIVSQIFTVIAFSLFGFALGSNVPKAFAIPGAVVFPWMWLVYPSAIEPLWLRHLNANLSGCCDISAAPSSSVVIAGALIAVAIAILSLALIPGMRGAVRTGLAVMSAGVLVVLAVSMVHGLGHSPAVERDANLLVCTDRVCVWPENRAQIKTVQRQAAVIRRGLERFGIEPAPSLTESLAENGSSWKFGTTPDSSSRDIGVALIVGLLPGTPACADSRPYDVDETRQLVERWIFESTGIDANGMEMKLDRANRRVYEQLIALPAGQQGALISEALESLKGCS